MNLNEFPYMFFFSSFLGFFSPGMTTLSALAPGRHRFLDLDFVELFSEMWSLAPEYIQKSSLCNASIIQPSPPSPIIDCEVEKRGVSAGVGESYDGLSPEDPSLFVVSKIATFFLVGVVGSPRSTNLSGSSMIIPLTCGMKQAQILLSFRVSLKRMKCSSTNSWLKRLQGLESCSTLSHSGKMLVILVLGDLRN